MEKLLALLAIALQLDLLPIPETEVAICKISIDDDDDLSFFKWVCFFAENYTPEGADAALCIKSVLYQSRPKQRRMEILEQTIKFLEYRKLLESEDHTPDEIEELEAAFLVKLLA